MSTALALASPCLVILLVTSKSPYGVLIFAENWAVYIGVAFGVGFALAAIHADSLSIRVAAWFGLALNGAIIADGVVYMSILIWG